MAEDVNMEHQGEMSKWWWRGDDQHVLKSVCMCVCLIVRGSVHFGKQRKKVIATRVDDVHKYVFITAVVKFIDSIVPQEKKEVIKNSNSVGLV